MALTGKRILLVIGGGIAAYKTLDLIRRLREKGATVASILTKSGAEFVTPLSIAALSGEKVYQNLFDLTDETEMGHIQLSRNADLLVVAPATANILSKMAAGRADDLATTALLATDKKVLVAPAMNVRMWEHPATRRNVAQLREDGILFTGPTEGDMACGEFGVGRLAEPADIIAAIETALTDNNVGDTVEQKPLLGKRVLVTAGPTHEPIDPVRYIANRSSGKQGYAIAESLAGLGARVTLVSGPVSIAAPKSVTLIEVETADEMLQACLSLGKVDIAVCAAAVADWRIDRQQSSKIKKKPGVDPVLPLVENPDILRTLSRQAQGRATLVIGFAAETDDVVSHARAKLTDKGCDWIIANDVSPGRGIMGGDNNQIHLVRNGQVDSWPVLTKKQVAEKLAWVIAGHFDAGNGKIPLKA